MLSKYDNILVGMLTAIVISVVAYALLLTAEEYARESINAALNFKPRTLALLAICINVLPMNYFRRRYHNKSLRGLVIGTVLLAGVWFVYFGRDLLNGPTQ